MNPSDLKPGVYVLANTVKNPTKRDRRMTRDWREDAEWPAGAKFVVVKAGQDDRRLVIERVGHYASLSINYWIDRTPESLEYHGDGQRRALALIEQFNPGEETLKNFLHEARRLDYDALDEAVEILIESGKITLDDVKGAWKAAIEAADRKQEEEEKA